VFLNDPIRIEYLPEPYVLLMWRNFADSTTKQNNLMQTNLFFTEEIE